MPSAISLPEVVAPCIPEVDGAGAIAIGASPATTLAAGERCPVTVGAGATTSEPPISIALAFRRISPAETAGGGPTAAVCRAGVLWMRVALSRLGVGPIGCEDKFITGLLKEPATEGGGSTTAGGRIRPPF